MKKLILALCLLFAVPTYAEAVTEAEEPDIILVDEGTDRDTESDELTLLPVLTMKDFNYEGETDVFKYTINSIQISTINFKDDTLTELLELETGVEYGCIVIEYTFENTGKDTMYIQPNDSTIVVNKEQVNANYFLSDDISGEYLGSVQKDGQLIYILQKSVAEDIKEFRLVIKSPYDEGYEHHGEDIDLTFKVGDSE